MTYNLKSFDDINRMFSIENNNIVIDFIYPKDIQFFSELSKEDLDLYISGFSNMFEISIPENIPVENMVF